MALHAGIIVAAFSIQLIFTTYIDSVEHKINPADRVGVRRS